MDINNPIYKVMETVTNEALNFTKKLLPSNIITISCIDDEKCQSEISIKSFDQASGEITTTGWLDFEAEAGIIFITGRGSGVYIRDEVCTLLNELSSTIKRTQSSSLLKATTIKTHVLENPPVETTLNISKALADKIPVIESSWRSNVSFVDNEHIRVTVYNAANRMGCVLVNLDNYNLIVNVSICGQIYSKISADNCRELVKTVMEEVAKTLKDGDSYHAHLYFAEEEFS